MGFCVMAILKAIMALDAHRMAYFFLPCLAVSSLRRCAASSDHFSVRFCLHLPLYRRSNHCLHRSWILDPRLCDRFWTNGWCAASSLRAGSNSGRPLQRFRPTQSANSSRSINFKKTKKSFLSLSSSSTAPLPTYKHRS